MALSALPSLPIRQSALFSESAPGSMALEPSGPNHLSATEEGHRDMLWPLEQWIFTVSRPGKEIHPLAHSGYFSVPPLCQSETCYSANRFFLLLSFFGGVGELTTTRSHQEVSKVLFVFLPLVFISLVFQFPCQFKYFSPTATPTSLTSNCFPPYMLWTGNVWW